MESSELPPEILLTERDIALEMGKTHPSLNLLSEEGTDDLSKFATRFTEHLHTDDIPSEDKTFTWRTIVRTWSHVMSSNDENLKDVATRRQFASILINAYATHVLPTDFRDIAIKYVENPKQISSTKFWNTEQNLKAYLEHVATVSESIRDLEGFLYGTRHLEQVRQKGESEESKHHYETEKLRRETPEGRLVADALETFRNAFLPINLNTQIATMQFERQKSRE